MSKMLCWKCGHELVEQLKTSPSSRYCAECGGRIVQTTVSSPGTGSNDHKDDDSVNGTSASSSRVYLNTDDHVIDESHFQRGLRWRHMLSVDELRSRFQPDLYMKLLNTHTIYLKKIRKDLGRTFPDHKFFKHDPNNDKRHALENILRAYSVYDSDIGYSQGMAFIAGHLLLHMNEEHAFWTFVKLLFSSKHNLRDIFNGECNVLPLCLREFDRALAKTRPNLHTHLTNEGVDASMYATQWFLTVFVYRFPSSCLPLIWDRFVAVGIVAIFQVGLALLGYFALDLLKLSSETLIPFFNSLHTQSIPDEIIEMSKNVRLPPFKYIVDCFDKDVPIIIDDTGRKREVSLCK